MERIIILVTIILLLSPLLSAQQLNDESRVKYGAFSFTKEVTLPGTPEVIFDAATGDISGWWEPFCFRESVRTLY